MKIIFCKNSFGTTVQTGTRRIVPNHKQWLEDAKSGKQESHLVILLSSQQAYQGPLEAGSWVL